MGALQSNSLDAALRSNFGHNIDVQQIRGVIGAFFWQWYADHSGDTILKRTVIVFRVTIKVRDLRVLFVALFGEPSHVVV